MSAGMVKAIYIILHDKDFDSTWPSHLFGTTRNTTNCQTTSQKKRKRVLNLRSTTSSQRSRDSRSKNSRRQTWEASGVEPEVRAVVALLDAAAEEYATGHRARLRHHGRAARRHAELRPATGATPAFRATRDLLGSDRLHVSR